MIHDLYKQKYDSETNNYNRVDQFEAFPRLTYISASTDIGLVVINLIIMNLIMI